MLNSTLNKQIQVLGIAGSLRQGSYNRALLRAAQELAPEDMEIKIFDNEILRAFPPYNEDLRQRGDPDAVKILKEEIWHADALMFAIPEYNHSMSGVLKNAVDWVSRPPSESPLDGKPVAIMGASVGMSGTVRAQMHFRQTCVFANMLPVNKPGVMVAYADKKFDDSGRLVDDDSRDFVRQLDEALLEWTCRLYYGGLMLDIGNLAIPMLESLESESVS